MPTTPQDCAQALLDSLPPVMWFIRRQMRRHRQAGLSVPQFRILVLLNRQAHASLTCICEHLGCTAPTASRLVTGLVRLGLIERCTSADDRRQIALALTPRGQAALQASRQATVLHLSRPVAELSPRQRQVVVEAMDLLRPLFTVPDHAADGPTPRRAAALRN